MPDALIGHTGFVGGHLSRQRHFDAFFNSANAHELDGRHFELLVCSAMPAAKWLANREPERDAEALARLCAGLGGVTAERAVVVSTVDVYASPVLVDESTPIDPGVLQPYGRNRFLLEAFARDRFDRVVVVRLPGLFGAGLRKNALFDLITGNRVDQINGSSVYQFYNLDRLWDDVATAMARDLDVVNFATEPIEIGQLARDLFGLDLPGNTANADRYDVRSRYAHMYSGPNGYLYERESVLDDLRQFVEQTREARS